jgi:hypothetical protein
MMLAADSAVPWYQQPLWLILGAVAGVATLIGLAIALFQLYQWWVGRERLLLTYDVLSSEYLVSVKEAEELRDRLSITFDNQPAQGLDIRAYLVEFRNAGTRDVSDTRFRSKVEFLFGDQCEVLTDGDVREKPELAAVVLTRNDTHTKLVLEPLLLKKGEWVLVRALVKNGGRCKMMARLDEVTLVNADELFDRKGRHIGRGLIVLLLMLLVASIFDIAQIVGWQTISPNQTVRLLWFIALCLIVFVVVEFFIYLIYRQVLTIRQQGKRRLID